MCCICILSWWLKAYGIHNSTKISSTANFRRTLCDVKAAAPSKRIILWVHGKLWHTTSLTEELFVCWEHNATKPAFNQWTFHAYIPPDSFVSPTNTSCTKFLMLTSTVIIGLGQLATTHSISLDIAIQNYLFHFAALGQYGSHLLPKYSQQNAFITNSFMCQNECVVMHCVLHNMTPSFSIFLQ